VETLYRAGLSNAVSAAVLALVVACLGRVLWRRPALLHCLWLLVLLKLVTPPLYQVPIPWIEATSTVHESDSVSATEFVVADFEPETAIALANSDHADLGLEAVSSINVDRRSAGPAVVWTAIDWYRLACLIWFTGTASTIFLAIGRIRRFQALLGEAQPADSETHEWVDELAASLGMDRSPSVWWVAGKLSPLVWSLSWRPRLVLPRQLWKGLDDHQRATLIIHELAHLRRGDHYLRFFELIVTALYWWHPVVWWARRSLRDVEEQCCDAWVVWALPDAIKSYADTLLETIDFLNPCDLAEPLLASGFGKVHHLRKRLTMIMTGTTPRLLGVWGTLGTLALAVVLLPVNVSLAQKPEEKTTEEKKEVQVVITSDDITSSSASAVATADGTASEVVTIVSDGEGGAPEQVKVVVKTDGSEGSIAAGSLDEAVAKLKTQIKELADKSPQSDKDKARQKALEHALKELERTAASIKKLSSNLDKVKPDNDVRALVIRRDDERREISPEKKAEIEKAAAKVAELARAVQAKQKELTEAQANLSKLTGQNRVMAYTVNNRVQTRPVVVRDTKELPRTPIVRPFEVKGRVTAKRDGEAGEKRIEALEKKLEKLLEEVASLKKDRTK
jgi:bla regulator protein blaR1